MTWEYNKEIKAALAYARETNSLPSDINNRIFYDMINARYSVT